MAMIRPTLLLRMDLDERIYSDEVVAEIKRSYSYVAPSLVESHEAAADTPENMFEFIVKIRKPYWERSEEGADDLWNDVMLKWFSNMFYKVSTTMVAYNKSRHEKGEQELDYAWLEIDLGTRRVALRLAADSSIPDEALALITRCRELMNEGTLPDEDAICVRMPSRKSYEDQMVAATATAAVAGESAAEEATSVKADREKMAAEESVATEQTTEQAAGQAVAEQAAEQVAAAPAASALAHIDYGIWGIEHADGSVEEFDAH